MIIIISVCACAGATDQERSANETAGRYKYTQDLLQLEAYRPSTESAAGLGASLPGDVGVVRTPLRVAAWEVALRRHPDCEFVGFLLRGMAQGFRIGFDRSAVVLKSAKRNMRSTKEVSEVVQAYLQAEKDAGRVIGPIPDVPDGQLAHVSRFGVISKPHQPGKWRLIVDLSHPPGHSVNDGVYPKWCSLEYASLDQAASIILSLGRGVQLAKLDVASAYRIVPVHPEDRPLLGMKWKGELYIDTALVI